MHKLDSAVRLLLANIETTYAIAELGVLAVFAVPQLSLILYRVQSSTLQLYMYPVQ